MSNRRVQSQMYTSINPSLCCSKVGNFQSVSRYARTEGHASCDNSRIVDCRGIQFVSDAWLDAKKSRCYFNRAG
eukprot:IDg13161t1